MKRTSQGFLVFVLFTFLVLSYIASARVLTPKNLKQDATISGDQKAKIEETTKHEDISNLMGLDEICGGEGEECTAERKLLAEAHLDYIYTQKHNKP